MLQRKPATAPPNRFAPVIPLHPAKPDRRRSESHRAGIIALGFGLVMLAALIAWLVIR